MFTRDETNKVKGIAICLLIFHHMYRTVQDIQIRGTMLHILTGEQISKMAYCFRICVYIFAILTAYGVTLCYIRWQEHGKSTLRFLLQRYLKLLAPFWFTLVLLYIVYAIAPGLQPFASYQGNVKYLLGDFFAVLDLVGKAGNMFNGVFWYMNFAVVEIVLIPLIYFLARKFGYAILVFTSVFWGFIPRAFNSIYGGDYVWYIFAIEFGVLAACNNPFGRIKEWYEKCAKWKQVVLALALLLSAGAFPYMAWFKVQFDYFGISAIFHTMGAVAVILFSYLVIKGKVISHVLMVLGKYSADMFLIHTIVFVKLDFIVCRSSNMIVQYLVCVVLCLLISFLIAILKKYTGYNRLVERMAGYLGR